MEIMDQKMNRGFGSLGEALRNMNATLRTHTDILEENELRQRRLEARRNNAEFPLDLWEVPNLKGIYPSNISEFDGFAPIRSVVQIVGMDNKGKLLNNLLEFYGFKEGRGKDFNATGPIEQRKILLVEELGAKPKHVSRAALQFE
eukprot:gb/GECH01012122.1/.p1 GENE.gb/GECH01012122.1/~~gb/GECH01012122.1/.p1  ORF type:complete len:145 (+),score=9.69 gb/GECH01012122.1/:1-435(+)